METIQFKLTESRRKHRRLAVLKAAGAAMVAILLGLTATMLLDGMFELPAVARSICLTATLVCAVAIVVRFGAIPTIRSPDDDTLALRIEKKWADYQGSLIAAVQLTRHTEFLAGNSSAMIVRTVQLAEERAEGHDFKQVVDAGKAIRMSVVATIALIVFTAGVLTARQTGAVLFRRAAMLSGELIPRRTRVELTQAHLIAARGEPMQIRVRASGVIPGSGVIKMSSSSTSTDRELKLRADTDNPSEFVFDLDNVADSFEYTAVLGDGRSPIGVVQVVPRPATTSVNCVMTPPAYTRLPPTDHSPTELSVLQGTSIALGIRTSKPMKDDPGNRIELIGSDAGISLRCDPSDSRKLVSDNVLIPPGTTGMRVHLKDEFGLVNRDPVVYAIELLRDRAPSARITSPTAGQLLATAKATVRIGIEAIDDSGIAGVRLKMQVLREGKNVATSMIPLQTPDNQRTVKAYHPMMLAGLHTKPGDIVEWWVEVEDNNTLSGPGRAETEHFVCKIVSDDEKRAELLRRSGNYLGQIEDISRRQRDLGTELGELLSEKK